jgi:signal transduction histidine kinase
VQDMPMERVDISELAASVVAELPPLRRQAAIEWSVAPGLQAWASPAALRIVLANLLGNAAKFTRKVSTPAVSLSGHIADDGRLHISVQDNGAGFEPALANRLFMPFSRLHGGEDFLGTGIGLTIVQRIIERHGGSVSAQGEIGHGARFEFTLATEKPADPPA